MSFEKYEQRFVADISDAIGAHLYATKGKVQTNEQRAFLGSLFAAIDRYLSSEKLANKEAA